MKENNTEKENNHHNKIMQVEEQNSKIFKEMTLNVVNYALIRQMKTKIESSSKLLRSPHDTLLSPNMVTVSKVTVQITLS